MQKLHHGKIERQLSLSDVGKNQKHVKHLTKLEKRNKVLLVKTFLIQNNKEEFAVSQTGRFSFSWASSLSWM